jgi:NADPH-dependent 2,4-dienoyl-CoA reductase/sulfur reductase-like enzyme
MHLLIVGGRDAGISAALRAHELDPGAEITIVLADDYPNFSICGLPYYLSGETPDWRQLAHRTDFPGIRVLRRHTARAIDAAARTVSVEHGGPEMKIRYDKLIVATGASPVQPEVPGRELPGVFPLHTMGHSFAVHRHLEERSCESAVLVGGGYIGLEMADALTHRGLDVTLLSRTKTVLPTVDAEIGHQVADELRRHGCRSLQTSARLGIDDYFTHGGLHCWQRPRHGHDWRRATFRQDRNYHLAEVRPAGHDGFGPTWAGQLRSRRGGINEA